MRTSASILALGLALTILPSSIAAQEQDHYARGIVIQALQLPNQLRVTGREFRTKANPRGDGVFVYDPRTTFGGVKRNLIWIVLGDDAYPLNGPSKMLTPDLKWPREIPVEHWSKTGLSPYDASAAIDIVFRTASRA